MMERNSYATFKDGHTEKVSYFEKVLDGYVFATESGFYFAKREPIPVGVSGLIPKEQFYRLCPKRGAFDSVELVEFLSYIVNNIESVVLDAREEYTYSYVDEDGERIEDSILVKPNATNAEIQEAILTDICGSLHIKYEKKGR